MSGRVGENEETEEIVEETVSFTERLTAIRENIIAFFSRELDAGVGIMVDDDAVVAVLMERGERIDEEECVFLLRETTRFSLKEERTPEDIAESVAVILAQKGWEHLPLSVALPKEVLQTYDSFIPRDIDEWEEAARWDFVTQLGGGEAHLEDYAIAMRHEKETCHMVAVKKDVLSKWKRAFRKASLGRAVFVGYLPGRIDKETEGLYAGLDCLRLEASGLESEKALDTYGPAIGAALETMAAGGELALSFRPQRRETSRIAYRRVAAAVLVATGVILSGLLGADLYHVYAADQAAEDAERERSYLRTEEKEMALLEKVENDTKEREKILVTLSEDSLPAYGLLIHLGTGDRIVDGVWLERVTMEPGGAITLNGHAVEFSYIADYIRGVSGDRFFKNSVLKEAGEEKGKEQNDIPFTIHSSIKEDSSGKNP